MPLTISDMQLNGDERMAMMEMKRAYFHSVYNLTWNPAMKGIQAVMVASWRKPSQTLIETVGELCDLTEVINNFPLLSNIGDNFIKGLSRSVDGKFFRGYSGILNLRPGGANKLLVFDEVGNQTEKNKTVNYGEFRELMIKEYGDCLTESEYQTALLMIRNQMLTNEDVAEMLSLTVKGLERRITSMYRKILYGKYDSSNRKKMRREFYERLHELGVY
jgi:hypothetical protein